jgi:predicted acyl esterase
MTTKHSPAATVPATRRKTRTPVRKRSGPAHPRGGAVAVPDIDDEFEPDQPFAEGALDAIDPELRHRMVSEAAYRLYGERGYEDGYDLDDWLQAEAAVDHLLLNPRDRAKTSGRD